MVLKASISIILPNGPWRLRSDGTWSIRQRWLHLTSLTPLTDIFEPLRIYYYFSFDPILKYPCTVLLRLIGWQTYMYFKGNVSDESVWRFYSDYAVTVSQQAHTVAVIHRVGLRDSWLNIDVIPDNSSPALVCPHVPCWSLTSVTPSVSSLALASHSQSFSPSLSLSFPGRLWLLLSAGPYCLVTSICTASANLSPLYQRGIST